jgi:hypothetical protein
LEKNVAITIIYLAGISVLVKAFEGRWAAA